MIEELIEKLTSALHANTKALNEVLHAAGAITTETPAPPKKRATKKAKTAPEEPAKTETPEPAAETTPEPEPATTGLTVDDVAQMVRDCYATAGDDKQAKKDAYNALRAEFGIEKLSELAGDKRLPEFAKRVQAL